MKKTIIITHFLFVFSNNHGIANTEQLEGKKKKIKQSTSKSCNKLHKKHTFSIKEAERPSISHQFWSNQLDNIKKHIVLGFGAHWQYKIISLGQSVFHGHDKRITPIIYNL